MRKADNFDGNYFWNNSTNRDNGCIFLRSFRTMKSHVHRRHLYSNTACSEWQLWHEAGLFPDCQELETVRIITPISCFLFPTMHGKDAGGSYWSIWKKLAYFWHIFGTFSQKKGTVLLLTSFVCAALAGGVRQVVTVLTAVTCNGSNKHPHQRLAFMKVLYRLKLSSNSMNTLSMDSKSHLIRAN